ncbi:MAG TPA: exonuclease, partial [Haliscomenobacter sp.]|nr:exonuclease [Haliscomenobacter sp.]
MAYIMVDVEADGPIPGDYSMLSLGAVLVTPELDQTFFAQFRPISEKFVPQALAVSQYSREESLSFPEPAGEMQRFVDWLKEVCPDR